MGRDGPVDAGYAITEHTADVGLRAWGATEAEVFEQAALAMFSLICDPSAVAERETRTVDLEAPADDLLLIDWLNELLFLFEAHQVVFARFVVEELGGGRLRARAVGEPLTPERHDVRAAVKAATYHWLSLQTTKTGWEARVILDV